MLNWGPVLVGVVLFVVLTPGLLFQVPGRRSLVEFGNLQTSGTSILVHSLIYFCLVCLFIIVINLQIYIDREMADWGPVVISVVLFVLLSPGLLFQLPGKGRVVEFGNMQTSGPSILVHTIIFFCLTTIFLIALGVHIYAG
ncbi:hypothetical protein CRG98_002491 [Punica granatum]|uniref:Transmembrane protein n=1 Tax=Punica granatum TaxID=22663 RepID=A0A2I0L8F5_PUNGR|nr:hypothetical protein CRG98_002491 [Punica granatum]